MRGEGRIQFSYWRALTSVLVISSILITRCAATNQDDEEAVYEDGEEMPEFIWQFQKLLRCAMGMENIQELLAKFNCSECDRCFKQWNMKYYELNLHPICEEYEGQLYALQYDFECAEPGHAYCVKTPNRCPYETCKLDTQFVTCLKNVKISKSVAK